jgi:hypothetical protein
MAGTADDATSRDTARTSEAPVLHLGRLVLVAHRGAAGATALSPLEARDAVTALCAGDPRAWARAAAWPPVRAELERLPQSVLEALARLVLRGEVTARYTQRARHGSARQPRAPSRPRPQPTARAVVSPIIDVDPAVVLVHKAHRRLERRAIRLTTDEAFDGDGLFRCASDAVRFYRDAVGGSPLAAATGVPLAGRALSAGLIVYAEGVRASASHGDVSLELAIAGGSKRCGPPAHARVTSVDVRLELYPAPHFGDGAERVPEEQLATRGGFLHVRDDRFDRHRALLIVGPPEPTDFDGTLELVQRGALELFREDGVTDTIPVASDRLRYPPGSIPGAGDRLWLEARHPHVSELALGVVGVQRDCELAVVHAVALRFSASPIQRHGYDDMDEDGSWHHVSVKSGGGTYVRVTLAGTHDAAAVHLATTEAGVASLPAPALASPELDLRVDGAGGVAKAATVLEARLHGPRGPRCVALHVHVYREVVADVVLVRVEDPRSPATRLTSWFDDLQAVEERMNRAFRQAVARVQLREHQGGAPLLIAYDADRSGTLEVTNDVDGSAEDAPFAPLARLAPFTVVIVRDMRMIARIEAAVAPGDLSLRLVPAHSGAARSLCVLGGVLGRGHAAEAVRGRDLAGATIFLDRPLVKAHAAGTPIFIHVRGLASSTPIFVREGDEGLDVLLWIIAHELAHPLLEVLHQSERDNLMQGFAADAAAAHPYPRLRYKPMRTVEGDMESQWEAVPRRDRSRG